MPILELTILEIYSFPHFSLTCFDILSWNFAFDFVLLYLRWSSSVVNFCRSYAPFITKNTGKFSIPYFSLKCFNILSWNFTYDFVLHYYTSSSSVIDSHQFLYELCPFWNLEYWRYTVFRNFLLRAPPTCIDKFSWNLKFHVGFFNAFLLEKYYTKIAFLNVHDGRIMHRLRCSGIFSTCWDKSFPRTCIFSGLFTLNIPQYFLDFAPLEIFLLLQSLLFDSDSASVLLYFCHTCSLFRVELVVQFPARGLT